MEINEEMLVPRADDTRAMMRLKELLLAQKNPLEMRVVGDPYFTKTVREMFPPNVIDVSQAKVRKYRTTLRVYTFTLLNVKNHLQGATMSTCASTVQSSTSWFQFHQASIGKSHIYAYKQV